MLGEFASAGQLPAADLTQLWGGAAPVAQEPRPPSLAARPPSRRPLARQPIRQPADNAAWVLAAHSEAWERLSGAQHEFLCGLDGWHGKFFRWLDREVHEQGFMPWAVLQAAAASEEWLAQLSAIMARDPDLQPPPEELPDIVDQAWKAEKVNEATRVKAEVMAALTRPRS